MVTACDAKKTQIHSHHTHNNLLLLSFTLCWYCTTLYAHIVSYMHINVFNIIPHPLIMRRAAPHTTHTHMRVFIDQKIYDSLRIWWSPLAIEISYWSRISLSARGRPSPCVCSQRTARVPIKCIAAKRAHMACSPYSK